MKEYQHGAENWIWDWRVGKLFHQSRHLCRFSPEPCCNIYKGKADEREPSNDGSVHAKRFENHSNRRSSILKQAKEPSIQTIYAKAPSAKHPYLHFEMTPNNSENFESIWKCSTIQLYSCADESVQNVIFNTYLKFFTTDPYRLLEMIEALVTQKSNPMVHWITFASVSRHEDKPIQQYLVHLRAIVTDCNFPCPCCEHDLSDIYIKDQFIRGIANNALRTDLLAKAGVLKSLNQKVCHAESFESTLQDQTAMTDTSDTATIWMSTYPRWKKNRTARTN